MAATAQTIVWSRLTGTPSNMARSAHSALARMAMPMSVKRSRRATPMSAIGATTKAATWSAEKTRGNTVKWSEIGRWTMTAVGRWPQMSGEERQPPATSSWDSPMVATVRMGRRRNGRSAG